MNSHSLKKWIPTPTHTWDNACAAHLLRRTGFAPTVNEIEQSLLDGPTKTINSLIDNSTDSKRHNELDAIADGIAARRSIESLRGWWLMRMQHTTRPLHTRLAVMWHNHFATSNVKVSSPQMMLRQLRLIEKHASGSFSVLLLEMSKDPAMIKWLDGPDNVKGRPNENYARELFELFSLGIGNYSEEDIQNSARAFTGWSQKNGVYQFRKRDHDVNEKKVLGEVGDLNGNDICRIASEHPACARFIALRLLHEFVTQDPEEQLVQNVADELSSHGMNIGETLRTLFNSEAFFHPSRYRARIKSPIEYIIGMVRSLHLSVSADVLATATQQMSQSLFEPPSVKGWDGHKAWINSTTMLVRLNAAQTAADLVEDPANFISEQSNHLLVKNFSDLILDGRVPKPLVKRIRDLNSIAGTSRESIHLLLTSPEYQMA